MKIFGVRNDEVRKKEEKHTLKINWKIWNWKIFYQSTSPKRLIINH